METNFLFKLWIIIKLCLYYVQSKVVRNIIGQWTDKKQETIDNFPILDFSRFDLTDWEINF